jgi:hypothetical protein
VQVPLSPPLPPLLLLLLLSLVAVLLLVVVVVVVVVVARWAQVAPPPRSWPHARPLPWDLWRPSLPLHVNWSPCEPPWWTR